MTHKPTESAQSCDKQLKGAMHGQELECCQGKPRGFLEAILAVAAALLLNHLLVVNNSWSAGHPIAKTYVISSDPENPRHAVRLLREKVINPIKIEFKTDPCLL